MASKTENDDVVDVHTIINKQTSITLEIPYLDYMKFADALEIKYEGNFDSISNNRKPELNLIMIEGIHQYYNRITSSSTSLTFDGKPIRKDEAKKLAKIVNLLHAQPSYPYFRPIQISDLIKAILGKVDERTMKKYRKHIVNNSNKIVENGTYDVSPLYDIFPKSLLYEARSDFQN